MILVLSPACMNPEVTKYLATIGAKGGRAGKGTPLRKKVATAASKAAHASLTPEERSLRARAAAKARWAKTGSKLPPAV